MEKYDSGEEGIIREDMCAHEESEETKRQKRIDKEEDEFVKDAKIEEPKKFGSFHEIR